jgi:ectoine hydroxylase-related dioxygenase (phytanoyl-CoA dioxygenase family)
MHQQTDLYQFHQEGFMIIPQFFSHTTIHEILNAIEKVCLDRDVRKERQGSVYAIRQLLNAVPMLQNITQVLYPLVKPILGKQAKVVRAIFFDKTPKANWKVTWHQDLTIAVQKRREVEGFGPWSEKAGVPHVQPAMSILKNMLTLRIHLDESSAENGTLSIIPGSHRLGRISPAQIQTLRKTKSTILCSVPKGSVMFMRPLLLHASKAGINPSHRRVLHFEYSAESLPGGLEWYGT